MVEVTVTQSRHSSQVYRILRRLQMPYQWEISFGCWDILVAAPFVGLVLDTSLIDLLVFVCGLLPETTIGR